MYAAGALVTLGAIYGFVPIIRLVRYLLGV